MIFAQIVSFAAGDTSIATEFLTPWDRSVHHKYCCIDSDKQTQFWTAGHLTKKGLCAQTDPFY
jgi:hypothetical protein